MFPGMTLEFSNDFELLESEIVRNFPGQQDNFRRLVAALTSYDQFGQPAGSRSAREVVGSLIDDRLLLEMLFCPVLFYGGAREHDMDFGQFSILFRAIFLEGLARPLAGVRMILKRLLRKFCDLGGELRLRTGVERILVKDGRAERVVLENGAELEADTVLSSAGWPETMRLCGDDPPGAARPADCRLSSRSRFSTVSRGRWATTAPWSSSTIRRSSAMKNRPRRPTSAAASSARPTTSPMSSPWPTACWHLVLGNYDRWTGLDSSAYRQQKLHCYEPHGRLRRPLRPRFPQRRGGDRDADAGHHPPLHGPREGGHLRGRRKTLRRHHAPAEPLRLRQRPGPGRHHRHHSQRHQHCQPILAQDLNAAAASDIAALPRLFSDPNSSMSDFLKDAGQQYDVVVIGAGLAGLTAANILAQAGRSVLLLEQHSQIGGLAAWFRRPGGLVFDVALHGFPVGMIKSCRRYWSKEIADCIVQLKSIRFDNPMFSLSTSFDRQDFTRLPG